MGKEIVALTSWRGIAALLVVILHLERIPHWNWTSSEATEFLGRGHLWVDFFFVLSGFVISLVHTDDFCARFRWRRFRNYLGRRLRRIYPLHLAMLLAFIPLETLRYSLGGSEVPLQELVGKFVTNLLLIHAWGLHGTMDVWNRPSWSISAEWAAYLLFPLLVLLILRPRRPAVAISLLVVILLGLHGLSAYVEARNPDSSVGWGAVQGVLGFTYGVATFRLTRALSERPRLARLVGGDLSCTLAVAAVVIAFQSALSDGWVMPLFVWLVAGFALNEGIWQRALSHPVPHGLGIISYSIYLTHWAVIDIMIVMNRRLFTQVLEPTAADALAMMLALTFTLALSVVTYRLIEAPFRRSWRAAQSEGRRFGPGISGILPLSRHHP
jgi:peptidoglycan/LPS O-acetylase OafA/YrhL